MTTIKKRRTRKRTMWNKTGINKDEEEEEKNGKEVMGTTDIREKKKRKR